MELLIKFGMLGLVLLSLVKSSPSNQEGMLQKIKGKKWVLERMNGTALDTAVYPRPAFFMLSDSSRISGFSGCNNFFGTYIFENKRLSVKPVGQTMMACPPGMEEQPLLAILMSAEAIRLEKGKLLFYRKGKVTAVFREATSH